MFSLLAALFDSENFLPHGHCFLWLPAVLWLHVISDAVIGLAYFSIPVAIFYFARRRRDMPLRHLYVLFGLFIVLCGSTHFFSIWVLWNPDYGPEGLLKAMTAVVSAIAAVLVWRIMPVALTIPSPLELQMANTKLTQANLGIEQEVTKRTTELHKTNARLQESEKRLHQAQKMEAIGSLTGGMAHDFNNLLGVVIGNLDLVLEQLPNDSPTKPLAQEAVDAALRGADLTRRLLAFARQQPLQPQLVDINQLVEGITRLLSRMLRENIRLSLELGRDLWPVVVDPVQVESALTNLATNARDAMPNGGQLIIATRNQSLDSDHLAPHSEVAPGDYTVIEVTDTGIGMEKDVMNRIFEPFFTTKDRGKGSGLGLSMIFGFMKQSGGHINVYSEPGHGTTFRLYLPRAPADAAVVAPSVPSPAATGGHEMILVVEDNDSMRQIVTRQLSELGYRVLEAVDASAAFTILDSGAPVDLLFTDVVMPGPHNGIELAQIAQQSRPQLKVILTSGFPDTKLNGGKGPTAGLHLLSKPYRKQELARLLRDVLEGHDGFGVK